jgi:hypothetical protein
MSNPTGFSTNRANCAGSDAPVACPEGLQSTSATPMPFSQFIDFKDKEEQDCPEVDLSAFQRVDTCGAELAPVLCQAECVRLDMEDLEAFEVLTHQYEDWGITFENAIALQPSNPAFPSRAGKMVVIGAPQSGWIEARFRQPVSYVSSFVTSSRRMVMAAFDAHNRPVGQVELESANLATEESKLPPNAQLSLRGTNIHRITFSSLDGQVTLDELNFSF